MRLIISHVIDVKSEGFLLHALQTASLNRWYTDLESDPRECVVIDPSAVDEILLDDYRREAEGIEDEELEDEELEDEDDDEDDEDDDEENDDEDDEDEDEEEEPPMYVEGGKLHSGALGSTTSSTAAAGPAPRMADQSPSASGSSETPISR